MSKCILVVEDQEDSRRILRDLFGNAGFELIEAESGEDALSAVMTRRPDLILMDIQLPQMDGYEATRRIKSNPEMKEIPVIAVTSYALACDDAKALAAGCIAYVSKPFSPRVAREGAGISWSVPTPRWRFCRINGDLGRAGCTSRRDCGALLRSNRTAPRPYSISGAARGARPKTGSCGSQEDL